MEHGQTTKAIRRLNDTRENLSSELAQPCPCGACGIPIDENGDCGCDKPKKLAAGPGVIEAVKEYRRLIIEWENDPNWGGARERWDNVAARGKALDSVIATNDPHAATRAALEEMAVWCDKAANSADTYDRQHANEDCAEELRRRAALLQITVPNAMAGCQSEFDHVSGADNVATGSWNTT